MWYCLNTTWIIEQVSIFLKIISRVPLSYMYHMSNGFHGFQKTLFFCTLDFSNPTQWPCFWIIQSCFAQEKRSRKAKLDRKIHQQEEPQPPAVPVSHPPSQPPEPAADRAERVAEHGPRRKVTPGNFRSLLPKGGDEPHMSGQHDRSKKTFKVVYPCHLDLFQSVQYVFPLIMYLVSPAFQSYIYIVFLREPYSWFWFRFPAGDHELLKSCSRKWPTTECSTELDALKEVINWVYARYNFRYPDAKEAKRLASNFRINKDQESRSCSSNPHPCTN